MDTYILYVSLVEKMKLKFLSIFFNKWILSILIALLLTLVRIYDPAPLQIMRAQLFDYYQLSKPREHPETPYALVIDIDEESLEKIGQWPWPRTQIAEMLINIFNDGASAIATDVMFSEPDRTTPSRVAETNIFLREALGDKVNELPDNDELLADILSQVPSVIGYGISPNGKTAKDLKTSTVATLGESPNPYIYNVPGVLRNMDLIEKAATSMGNYMPLPEPDGIVRRIPLLLRQENKLLPWLALEAAMVSNGLKTVAIRTNQDGVEEVILPEIDLKLPTDKNGRMYVNFREFDKKYYIPAHKVLNNTFEPGTFNGVIAFLGASAVGLGDLHTFPFGKAIPGVEMHLQTIEMLFDEAYIYRPDYINSIEMLSVFFCVFFVSLLVFQLGSIKSSFLALIFIFAQAYGSYYLFSSESTLYDASYPIFSTFIAFILATTYAYMNEEKQKAYVKDAFSQYLSPELVAELVKNPDLLKLGGETRELTILFCDIRGFTSMSEALKDRPQELTSIVNMLLTELTTEVLANNGTIDKYMGDALMAFWNAPISDPNHKENALKTAIGLQQKMKSVNEKLSEYIETQELTGVPYMRVGVGVSSGIATVGNMGSKQRFNYSVIGDCVNLAARLEGQTKQYSVDNLYSEETITNHISKNSIEIDTIKVKGKKEAVTIFSIISNDSEILESEDYNNYVNNHNLMLENYKNRNWDDAEKYALKSMEWSRANTELYALYLDRFDYYKLNPPPHDWDGSYEAQTK